MTKSAFFCATDSLGGIVKQLATRAIISRKAPIKDANSLVEVISLQTRIHLKFMSEDEIERYPKQRNARVYFS